MHADLDTLLTALYVKIDDELSGLTRHGRPPTLTDAELVTLAVAQALLGIESQARWLRFAGQHLGGMFTYLPKRPGYNKRLRAALPLVKRFIRVLATDSDFWSDDVWIVDSTPVECGRSVATRRRSELAGWAGYGYCASHSRFFWGLRLHLLCTPAGLPIAWALTNPKIDEREVLADLFSVEPHLLAARAGQLILADKGYTSAALDEVSRVKNLAQESWVESWGCRLGSR